ncbi:MAG TPA: ROK family protein, partial [Bacteroidales bacterium]|nr:ROK family protein [Bacteroidales bacterium]
MDIDKKLAIGVDVGGSHVSCAAYDLKEAEYLGETFAESDLDNHAPANEIIAVWGKVIGETIIKAGSENVYGIGFAMPGPFDYPKGISRFRGENGKYENTFGLDVPAGIRKYLGLPPDFRIRFINDATAFAIGEDRFGMARQSDRSLSITLGTGFGSAFIRDHLP